MAVINRLKYTLAFLLLGSLFTGCPSSGRGSSQPEITLTVTDCATEDITMTLGGQVIGGTGNRWSVVATAEVKCSGTPVPGAEIKIEFWWPGGTFKRTTDAEGKVRYSRTVDADPSGNTFNVTIKGNNDEKVESFTYR